MQILPEVLAPYRHPILPHVLFTSHFYSCVSTCRLTPCIGDSLPSFPKIKPETQEAKSGSHFCDWFRQGWATEWGNLKPSLWTVEQLLCFCHIFYTLYLHISFCTLKKRLDCCLAFCTLCNRNKEFYSVQSVRFQKS